MNPMPTRLLLVEDNPGDALLLEEALKEKGVSPCLLERAGRLREGLDRLSKGNLDLVLLDLYLPDSSGLSTLKSALDVSLQVPIVVLTGLNNKETAMKSLQEGAQDFLVKDGLDGELLQRSISYSIERHRLLKKVREEEERYFLAALGSHDGLWDWDLRTGRIYFSPRWKLMLGCAEGEVGDSPKDWFGRVHPADLPKVQQDLSDHLTGATPHFANEHRLRHKDGRYRWVLSRGLSLTDGRGHATRIAGSFTDITRHKNMEQHLALRAYYDPLTGLPNRILFMESLHRSFARLNRHPSGLFALFFLDLDHLKLINDSMGHQAGDQLLIEFSKRLHACVRPLDLAARMSGDEFTVLLEDLRSHSEAVEIARRILEAMRTPFGWSGKELGVTVSIGIAYSDCGKAGPDGLLQAADSAMYRAKSTGKARFEIFGKGREGGSNGSGD